MKEKEILLRAAAIVRERWQQGDNGFSGGPRCALGAHAEAVCQVFDLHEFERATDESSRAYDRTLRALRSCIPGERAVSSYNDDAARTAEDVAQVFEKAAKEFE